MSLVNKIVDKSFRAQKRASKDAPVSEMKSVQLSLLLLHTELHVIRKDGIVEEVFGERGVRHVFRMLFQHLVVVLLGDLDLGRLIARLHQIACVVTKDGLESFLVHDLLLEGLDGDARLVDDFGTLLHDGFGFLGVVAEHEGTGDETDDESDEVCNHFFVG